MSSQLELPSSMALPYRSVGSAQRENNSQGSSQLALPYHSAPPVMVKPKPTLEGMPLEIKHQIFSYLLNGANVRIPDPKVNRPKVDFAWEVALLRVNKQLGEGAKAYLYSANTFVYCEYFWTGFLELPLNAGVPLVMELEHRLHELEFEHHHMHVYFQHGESLKDGLIAHMMRTGPTPPPGVKEIPLGAFIILFEDFEVLCRTIQFHHHLNVGHNVVIVSPPEINPVKYELNFGQRSSVIEVTLCQPTYSPSVTKPQAIMRQKKMLEPFHHLSTSMQTVIVKGEVDEKVGKALVKAMTPRIAWLEASGWTLYERMLEAKIVIDSMTEPLQCCVGISYAQYLNCATRGHMDNFLFRTHQDKLFLALEHLPKTQEAVQSSWQLGVITLAIECHVSQALISLEYSMTELVETINVGVGNVPDITILERYNFFGHAGKAAALLNMNELINKAIPAELSALVHHLMAVALATEDDGPTGSTDAMRELTLASKAFPAGNAKVMADMILLQGHINTRGTAPGLNPDSTSLKGRSVVCRFPLALKRPARYQGFRDVQHKLDADEEVKLTAMAVRRVNAAKQEKKDFLAAFQRREAGEA